MESPEGGSSSKKEAMDDVDASYFMSYEDVTVHTLMLKDTPRTLAYQQFMEQNPLLFKDKVVIDVGAGTGILSLFAAKAGAKKVYAIEASNMSVMCKQIVTHNGYQDQIEVVHGRVEDVMLPDGLQADVIVSEWMGFYLFHESMLNSVIVARDRWLAVDGVMVPSTVTLYLSPVSMKDYVRENFECWKSLYGFDFSPLLPAIQNKALTQPVITVIDQKQCLAEPELVTCLDIQFVTPADVKRILGNFKFKMTKNSLLHGFASWFDCEFEGDNSITLRTGPGHAKTHWQQTVMFLPHALLVNKEDVIACKMELTQDTENSRRYNICIELDEEEDDEEDDLEGENIPELENMQTDIDPRELLLKTLEKQYNKKI